MRKKKNEFAWPFSKKRQCYIAEADAMLVRAGELVDDPAVKPYLPNQFARYRRAAKVYEQSAILYRKAGLGLMAIGSWQDAAECYSTLGDDENCKRCECEASHVPVYYEEEV
jgi:lysine/ornithine N-monooxygenase